ncbi:LacI family DNA-binding transcriptional regulator [Georgenia alba]|uniref:LacI family DNA-binding transcriptional regulator n=1 Tax=Georgenia alba TaxID=2233858 RepID=A0ABW2Q1U7_9MICO
MATSPVPDTGRSSDGEPARHAAGRRRGATIQDVAREAGVSRAAVSKVIRNAYGVSDQMRARVEAAIATLDYRPRVAARAMRGASFTLGLEIPQIGNDFHSVIASAATEVLAETSYQVVIAPIRDPQQGDKALQSLADRQVDGIVAVAPLVSTDWLDTLAERVPLVMVGRHDVSTRYDTVAGDDESGAEQVMEHLVELGHRRIAFLDVDRRRAAGKSYISPTGRDPHSIRRRVYHEHMGALGLAPLVVESLGHMEEDAAAAVSEILTSGPHPTAIFAGHDTLAVGALRAVAAAGLDAEDVSVAGFDDIPIASHPLISLTSVDQQGYAMGAEAVRLLLERIDGRTEAVQVQMPTSLRVRASTRPPRSVEGVRPEPGDDR